MTRESDLHEFISAHCRARGWVYVHARMDKRTTTAKGVPDFLIWGSRRFLAIECKTAKGTLSPDQEAFAERMRRNGFGVQVVRTKEEFEELIRPL